MNNADLAAAVASEHGISQKTAKEYVDTIVKNMSQALTRGDEVNLTNFGKFKIKERAARMGRNPATGESVQIAASKKPAFTVAKGLKTLLNT